MQREAAHPKKTRPVTLRGRIVPTAWDEVDAVTEVTLEWVPRSETDAGDMRLHLGEHGQALLLFVGREVTVKGRLRHTDDGEPVLLVQHFRLHPEKAPESSVGRSRSGRRG